MDRRRFLLTSLAGALASPLAAKAQRPGKVWRIGFLSPGALRIPGGGSPLLDTFRDELRSLGYEEDRNVVLEPRYADGQADRLTALAEELVQARSDLIVTAGSQATQAAKRATATIPIVMIGVGDPVLIGLVASLSRPGGNVTGVAINTGQEFYGKYLEMLKEMVPSLSRVGVVVDPRSPYYAANRQHLESAARSLALMLSIHEVQDPGDLERIFAAIRGQRVQAIFVVPNPFVYGIRRPILDQVARHRIPAAFGFREFVDGGGLVYLGTDVPAMWRRAAIFVNKILKGAQPSDLPVEQPTKFELVINLKTAKALGLTIPSSLLARADQVIE
jgi:ABC-type uncharacterized transport system substrate-binding protein